MITLECLTNLHIKIIHPGTATGDCGVDREIPHQRREGTRPDGGCGVRRRRRRVDG